MTDPDKGGAEISKVLAPLLNEDNNSAVGILGALLDARIISGKTGLALKDMERLGDIFFPGEDPEPTLRHLTKAGLVRAGENDRIAVPEDLLWPLAREMDDFFKATGVPFSGKTSTVGGLLDEFAAYCRDECGVEREPQADDLPLWGGKEIRMSGQRHLLLIRPKPLFFPSRENSFVLFLGRNPAGGGRPLADLFSADSALRRRLAFIDLGKKQKMNLTKSGVFVFFERYLLRAHGLRLAPAADLTQSLVDNGLLSFDKG